MSAMKRGAIGIAVALGLVTFPSLSKADTYYFTQANCASGLGCDGSNSVIATVTTSTAGGNTVLTFAIVDSSFSFLQAGTPPQTVFDTGGTSFTIVSVSGTANNDIVGVPVGNTTSGWQPDSGGVVIGHSFPNGIGFIPNNNDTWGNWTITLSGLLTFTDLSGFYFGTDMCKGAPGPSCTGGTGFVLGVLNPVPIPPAAALFGSALVGLGLLARRRRKLAHA